MDSELPQSLFFIISTFLSGAKEALRIKMLSDKLLKLFVNYVYILKFCQSKAINS